MLGRVALLAALAALLPAGSAAAATARLTPSAAPPGTRVLVQGTGLERNQGVTVRLAGRTLAFVVADADGAFTAPVPLPPDLRPGNKPVRVQAGDLVVRPALRVVSGPTGGVPVSLAASDGVRATASDTVAPPGTPITLRLSGLPRRARVGISVTGGARFSLRAGPGGRAARAQLRLPTTRVGRGLIVVRLGRSALSIPTYALPAGSTAPPLPPPQRDPPLLAAAGDIACSPDLRRTEQSCHQSDTGTLLGQVQADAVAPLGDVQYETAAPEEWSVFDSTWGPYGDRMRPTTGNHEYAMANASGYFAYFGLRGGVPPRGWYSYELGAWHVIVLNSNCDQVDCSALGAQLDWLRADLAAHPSRCTLAYWHHPRFSSGLTGGTGAVASFWQALYEGGADLVLNGHDHDYERFAPQNPDGKLDPRAGIREFVVGTGGRSHTRLTHDEANSEVRDSSAYGLLALTLAPTGYVWEFVPEPGDELRDAGATTCHP
jgi:acid phosphatase type 7